jgi:hypothetical protein
MAFLLSEDKRGDARFDAYGEYLESIRDRLPASAYAFAAAPWHYDFSDRRCPHDSWVESLTVGEPSSGERRQRRGVEIAARLLGAYHDGHILLTYKAVHGYLLKSPNDYASPPLDAGHGDWLADEIRLSDGGLVLHEVEFSRGSRWVIECEDMTYDWEHMKESENG